MHCAFGMAPISQRFGGKKKGGAPVQCATATQATTDSMAFHIIQSIHQIVDAIHITTALLSHTHETERSKLSNSSDGRLVVLLNPSPLPSQPLPSSTPFPLLIAPPLACITSVLIPSFTV